MPPVLVKHLMTEKVVTFFAEQTLPLAEDVMRIHRFRHLPVIDNPRTYSLRCASSPSSLMCGTFVNRPAMRRHRT